MAEGITSSREKSLFVPYGSDRCRIEISIREPFTNDHNKRSASLMDLNRLGPGLLHAFLVVAEVGKISEAARRLHLSQPAVTAQIRRLEADLDMPLFIRSVQGVTLTPRGAHLRERLQRVFADLEEALSELDQPGELTGVLKFAASTTSAAHFVPTIFARFRRTILRSGFISLLGMRKMCSSLFESNMLRLVY